MGFFSLPTETLFHWQTGLYVTSVKCSLSKGPPSTHSMPAAAITRQVATSLVDLAFHWGKGSCLERPLLHGVGEAGAP